MKTTTPGIFFLSLVFCLFTLALALHAQTDESSSATTGIQQLAPGSAPPVGTFYLFADYLSNSNHMAPPYPMNPYFANTNITVYDLGNRVYMVDNSSNITSDAQLEDALNALEQSQADLASPSMAAVISADTPTLDSPSGADSLFPTNALWLSIEAVSNSFSFLTLHGTAEGSQYEILSRENLVDSAWYSETIVTGATNQDWTPFTISNGTRTNTLFFSARNLTIDSTGQGLPDWWQLQYFGHVGVDPYADPDNDGWNNLEEFLNGTDPQNGNLPPAPRNASAIIDTSGSNVLVTWTFGGGPVSYYTVAVGDETLSDDEFVESDPLDANTFSYTDGPYFELRHSPDVPSPQYIVRAYFTGGTSGTMRPNGPSAPHADTGRLSLMNTSVAADIKLLRGPGGQLYLAVGAASDDLSFIRFTWYVDGGDFIDVDSADFSATNLVNGICLLPAELLEKLYSSNGSFWAQPFSEKGAMGDSFFLDAWWENYTDLDRPYAGFIDASTNIADNLKFLIRAATATKPFSYISDQSVFPGGTDTPNDFNHPEDWFVRAASPTNCESYGYHFYSANFGHPVMGESRPIRDSFMWRNFVYKTNIVQGSTLSTGAGYDLGSALRVLQYPEYSLSLFDAETSAFPISYIGSSNWLYWCRDDGGLLGDLAVSEIGLVRNGTNGPLMLASSVRNCYGLPLLSLRAGNTGVYSPGATLSFESQFFPNFAAPILQTVDYYFAALQTSAASPPMPGSPDFTITNTAPILIASVGEPLTVTGWAKKRILNNYPAEKYAYQEQYFASAFLAGTNGIATTNSAGLLSPYGEFLPTKPGEAALITMPDIETGQQSTGKVEVITLATDANHDGKIDCTFGAPDVTSPSRPFRFWINDDDDSGETGGSDIPMEGVYQNNGPANWQGHVGRLGIDGVRDLVDWFPVYLNIRSLLEVLPPSASVHYKLKQADSGVNIAYTTLRPDNSGGYLTDTNVSRSLTNAEAFWVRNSGLELDTNFLGGITSSNRGIILVEGRTNTVQPLVLEVWRDTNLLAQTSLYLSISPVEKMFRHKNLVIYTAGTNGFPSADRLTDNDVPNEPDTNDKSFVFLHGYNVNPYQARGAFAETFKRMYWSGSHAKFYGVTWRGSESQGKLVLPTLTPDYHANVVNAFLTAPALADFLNTLPVGKTTIAAHSLGNMVVLSALNDWSASVSKYFMMDAAVAIEAIDTGAAADTNMVVPDWSGYTNSYWASEWFSLFPTNDARSQLTWRGRFSNLPLTNIYNFYSSGEEVLRTHFGAPPTLAGLAEDKIVESIWLDTPFASFVWALQEKEKGRMDFNWILGSRYGGWGFNLTDPASLDDPVYYQNFVENGQATEKRIAMSAPTIALFDGTLTNGLLQRVPFFDPGWGANEGILRNYQPDVRRGPNWLPDLYSDTTGSSTAANSSKRSMLLADMFPSLTLPVGANSVSKLHPQNGDDRNFDMFSVNFQNDWPSERLLTLEQNRWHHSDFREVAYTFTHKLFDKFVTLGDLK